MKTKFPILLPWVCSLGLAAFVGYQLGTGKSGGIQSQETTQGEQGGKKVQATKTYYFANEVPQAFSEFDLGGEDYLQEPLERSRRGRSLLAVMKGGDPVLRVQAFTESLQNLDESTLPGILEAFDALPKGFHRYTELRLLMHTWATRDPEAALEYANNLSRQERHFAASTGLASWAQINPDDAMLWAEANGGEREQHTYMPAIISGVSKTNMGKATDMLFEMDYGHTRGRALRTMITTNLQQGGMPRLTNWAESLPAERDPKLIKGIFSEVAEEYLEQDVEKAGEWVKSLSAGQGREPAIASYVDELAEDSPEQARDWLMTLPEKDQYEAMHELVWEWAKDDAAATGEWLNQFPPSEELDKAVATYVRSIRRKDPEAAKDWAASIVNEETRQQTLNNIGNPNGFQSRSPHDGEGRGSRGGN